MSNKLEKMQQDPLDLLRYRSNLLGADLRITNLEVVIPVPSLSFQTLLPATLFKCWQSKEVGETSAAAAKKDLRSSLGSLGTASKPSTEAKFTKMRWFLITLWLLLA